MDGSREPEAKIDVEAPSPDPQIRVDQLAKPLAESPVWIRFKRRSRGKNLAGEQPRDDLLKAILLRGLKSGIVVQEIHQSSTCPATSSLPIGRCRAAFL